MSNITIKDSIVFVTGANRERGIGRAVVQEAIKRGAKKVYATARNTSQLKDLVEESQGKIVPIELDVTNLEQINKVAQEAGDTELLINNAGTAGFSGINYNYSEETARQELEVNYFGVLNLIHAFSENLIKNQNGAIANVISIGGLSTFPMATFAGVSFSMSTPSAISVSIVPGYIPNTETPWGVNSALTDCVKECAAAFEAQ